MCKGPQECADDPQAQVSEPIAQRGVELRECPFSHQQPDGHSTNHARRERYRNS